MVSAAAAATTEVTGRPDGSVTRAKPRWSTVAGSAASSAATSRASAARNLFEAVGGRGLDRLMQPPDLNLLPATGLGHRADDRCKVPCSVVGLAEAVAGAGLDRR